MILISYILLQFIQGCNQLFKAEDFTPYDPTQDAIFPPELMVGLFCLGLQISLC